MPWIIDQDLLADKNARPGTNANAVGLSGPRGYPGDGSELACNFRMYDDDQELYYVGRSDEESFDPLDHFGMPNAGCTSIHYLDKSTGHWVQL
jgi:hypothetical protein